MKNKVNEKDKLIKELEELSKPLQKWLRKNYDLMCSILIDGYTSKIVRIEVKTMKEDEELIC